MRDRRFVTIHRGGLLTHDNHRKLIRWARECSEHVLPLLAGEVDMRLLHALQVSKVWEEEKVNTGEVMKASLDAHAVARESENPVAMAVARSIGQGVATAHMADHSIGAALYALVAVQEAGQSVDNEANWQNRQLQQLPADFAELVLSTIIEKGRSFKSLKKFFG